MSSFKTQTIFKLFFLFYALKKFDNEDFLVQMCPEFVMFIVTFNWNHMFEIAELSGSMWLTNT